jgi:hypothetical protein
MKRQILVILKNRFNPSQAAKYIELECKSDGSILKEQVLKRVPREAKYEEVWENNEGKTELASCMRMSKKYTHPLIKPRQN